MPNSNNKPFLFKRVRVDWDEMDSIQRMFVRQHNKEPKGVHVHVGLAQIDFIKRCIQTAMQHNPELGQEKDEYDMYFGSTLVELCEDTIKEPGEYGSIHGWVI